MIFNIILQYYISNNNIILYLIEYLIADTTMETKDKTTSKQTVSKQSGETPEKVVLSLDCATKTGYAIWRNGAIVKSGTKRFHHSECKRIKDYEKWLYNTLTEWGVTDVVAEDIYRTHDKQRDSAFIVLAEMRAITILKSGELGITPAFKNPLAVKKHMINGTTKDRKKDKQYMINRVTALGYKLETPTADDEADAIGIMLFYLYEYDLPITHPQK